VRSARIQRRPASSHVRRSAHAADGKLKPTAYAISAAAKQQGIAGLLKDDSRRAVEQARAAYLGDRSGAASRVFPVREGYGPDIITEWQEDDATLWDGSQAPAGV